MDLAALERRWTHPTHDDRMMAEALSLRLMHRASACVLNARADRHHGCDPRDWEEDACLAMALSLLVLK